MYQDSLKYGPFGHFFCPFICYVHDSFSCLYLIKRKARKMIVDHYYRHIFASENDDEMSPASKEKQSRV